MKYKKSYLVIILLVFLITPFSTGEDSDYEFTFVRLKYNGSYQYRSLWHIDHPTADKNLLFQLRKHTGINVNPRNMVVEVGSHELFEYPFAYIAELGRLNLSKAEAENLRGISVTWWVYHDR